MKQKYAYNLQNIPAPGGAGCHQRLLGIANLGIMAGYSPERIFSDIHAHLPQGTRRVSDREIWDAIRKAELDCKNRPHSLLRPNPSIAISTPLPELLKKMPPASESDLMNMSPIKIPQAIQCHSRVLLECLYRPDSILFIGERHDTVIMPMEQWLSKNINKYPLIMPNELTGKAGATKTGKSSLRSDDCIKDFRFVVAEFDCIALPEQIKFWHFMIREGLPVSTLIFSGGKSIHAWILVNCSNRTEWEQEIERKFFPEYLIPLGIDGACKNESRLSRLPGHYRMDKNASQRLIYLNQGAI